MPHLGKSAGSNVGLLSQLDRGTRGLVTK